MKPNNTSKQVVCIGRVYKMDVFIDDYHCKGTFKMPKFQDIYKRNSFAEQLELTKDRFLT